MNASGVLEEISTHKAMKSGTHLFGNVMSAIMNHGKSLKSYVIALLEFWEVNARREHAARDGCTAARDWVYAPWAGLNVYRKCLC